MLNVNGYTIKNPMGVLEALHLEMVSRGKPHILSFLEEHPDVSIRMKCPFHNGGYERNPSANIVLREVSGLQVGMFHCYACDDWRNTLDFFRFISVVLGKMDAGLEGINWCKERGFIVKRLPIFENCEGHVFSQLYKPTPSVKDILCKLKNEPTIKSNPYSYFDHDKNQAVFTDFYRREKIDNYQARIYHSEEELARYRYTHDYVYKRGVTDELIEQFDIGYDRKAECITFPCRDENGVYSIIRRSVKMKRFEIPAGEDKPIWALYDIPNDAEAVIICESIFNALSLWKWGYYAIALMGLGTDKQVKMINWRGWKNVYLALDGDLAGRKATEKLCKKLRWFVKYIYNIPDGKDVNDLSQEEFEALPIYQYPFGVTFGDKKYRHYKNAFKERIWNY